MSKFHALLNKAYREIITEQEQPPVQPAAPENVPTPEQSAPTPIPEVPQQPEGPVEPLTSEGETVLVRLLAKSLLINITDHADEISIKEMDEINAKNAQEILKKLVAIVRKYDPTVEDVLDINRILGARI